MARAYYRAPEKRVNDPLLTPVGVRAHGRTELLTHAEAVALRDALDRAINEFLDECHDLRPDVDVTFDGSLYLFRPRTPDADTFLRERTDGTWFGDALVVEHRYAGSLVDGLTEHGYVVGLP